MRVAIYTPYLDTIGGGEKYMLTIAETFLEKDHEVVLFLGTHLYDLDTKVLKEKVQKIHGIDLEKVMFARGPFGVGSSTLERYKVLKKFDLFFYLTDGSIFYTNAKKNILHFQVPFETFNNSFTNRIKLKSWQTTIFNSRFTKKIVEKKWPIKNGVVVYPPVTTGDLKPLKKENIIISVGRFHMATKSKKHEVMIDAFSRLVNEKKIKGWKLILAGGMEEGNELYIEELKSQTQGLAVEILVNISLSELHTLYGRSKIYWHAAGFGEDDPKKHEHFGITTVESMAAGCVPVVINKGGQPEIVEEGCGYVWDSIDDLLKGTKHLIDNEKIMEKMSQKAIERSKIFDKQHFKQALLDLVYER